MIAYQAMNSVKTSQLLEKRAAQPTPQRPKSRDGIESQFQAIQGLGICHPAKNCALFPKRYGNGGKIRAFFVNQKGTTMNFKTIAVALSLALAFQPVTSFAAGTSSTALSAAAKNRLAQKLKSLAARNLPTTGVDPGTGSAAATYSAPAPADTGNSVVIESGVVVSGGLY